MIAAPSYMSFVNGKRKRLANELLAKVVPSVSEKQQAEREQHPSDASTHIDELFQSLSFNTAEFAHDLRSHETVKFLHSLPAEGRANVVSQLFIVRAGTSKLNSDVWDLGTRLGQEIDRRWMASIQESAEQWKYVAHNPNKFAKLDLGERCEQQIRSSLSGISRAAYDLVQQTSTTGRNQFLEGIGTSVSLAGAVAELPAIAIAGSVTLPQLAVPVFILGGGISLMSYFISSTTIAPEELQRQLTSRVKEAGIESARMFTTEFRANLVKLHEAENAALMDSANYVATIEHPYF
jgi:hypothetical protein